MYIFFLFLLFLLFLTLLLKNNVRIPEIQACDSSTYNSHKQTNTFQHRPGFMTSDDLLEDSNTGPSLSFPVLWVRVQSLQHIKRFSSVVELTHLWREKKRKKGNDFLKQIKRCDGDIIISKSRKILGVSHIHFLLSRFHE